MHRYAARTLAAVVVVAGMLTALVPPADGTTLIRRSTAELTVLSEHVVEGIVTNVESRYREDHKFVYTYVTIEVAESFKGDRLSNTIVLEELGGEANGMTVTVPSNPVFEVGQRAIFFLDVKDERHLRVHGMEQGKFDVFTNEATGEKIVTRPASVDAAFNYSREGVLDSSVDPATGKRPYARFVSTINEYADRLTVGGE